MAITLDGTNGILSPDFEPSSSTTPTNGLFLPTTNALGFATNSAERLRLDASGNLGLGVTPSAWSAVTPAFELGTTGGFFAINNNFSSIYNAYYNGTSYIYKTSRFASQYTQASGEHRFFTAPSGTAGNAISFTQAMTLDGSGRLTIPSQPSCCRRLTTNNTGPALIAWDTSMLDNGITYNATTKRFTVPIAGKYMITVSGFATGASTTPTRILLGVNTDTPSSASNYGHTYTNASQYNAVYSPISFVVILNINANDYFTFYLPAGTLYSTSTDLFNYMSANLIG